MRNLSCTSVQLDILWHAPEENRKRLDQKLDLLTSPTDIVILPEMFTTGFTMEAAAHAEHMDGPTMTWMAAQAEKINAVICGSLIIEESGKYFNRFIWMYPGGMYHSYDKRHLFKMAGEHEVYTPGEERQMITHKGWKICPMICYDLRFPVWSRNDEQYDLLIYVANWPEKRIHHWRSLIQARAIENQAFVIGVNRYGTDENGHTYSGDTCVADPISEAWLYHNNQGEEIHTITLSGDHLIKTREKLPFLVDQDEYKIL